MKKAIWLLPLAGLLTPAVSMAQGVFDGTWKVDMSTAKFPEKPDVYVLQGGTTEVPVATHPNRRLFRDLGSGHGQRRSGTRS
jgi:hypothetical protein